MEAPTLKTSEELSSPPTRHVEMVLPLNPVLASRVVSSVTRRKHGVRTVLGASVWPMQAGTYSSPSSVCPQGLSPK